MNGVTPEMTLASKPNRKPPMATVSATNAMLSLSPISPPRCLLWARPACYRDLKALSRVVFGPRRGRQRTAFRGGGMAVIDRAVKRTPVAQAVSLILGTSIFVPAFAQEAPVQEVV